MDRGGREVWAKVLTHRSRYYISREDLGDKSYVDDEAEIEILASIDAITASHGKQIGHDMVISPLAAERYVPSEGDLAVLRLVESPRSQRSALATYQPLRSGRCHSLWLLLMRGFTLAGRS